MSEPRTLVVPEVSLVVLIGASGSGKSTFARAHFCATEVVSSDACRGLVSDDENDQGATADAFEILHAIVAKRLERGRLTVVDATNVQPAARSRLVALARAHHVLPVAIVFDLAETVCQARNKSRPDRQFGPHVVRRQSEQLRKGLHGKRGLEREGFRSVAILRSEGEVGSVEIVRQPLWTDRRDDHGPFDIVGDVHGCFAELLVLLARLGYEVETHAGDDGPRFRVRHPDGRHVIFLGDLVDRGPRTPETLRLVMDAVADDVALCIPGNHDDKLLRALRGRNVQVTHGLDESLRQLDAELPEFRQRVVAFLDGLISHYVLDGGELVVAHAGLPEALQGRSSRVVRDFALYGETTGETDAEELPVRGDWARSYRGAAAVVYGHTPVAFPEWVNQTINIDTGCVFGGSLTALRWPERELVSIPAERRYAEPARPFVNRKAELSGAVGPPETRVGPGSTTASPLTGQQRSDAVLDLADVAGHRVVETRLHGRITIRAEQAAAALETIARFSVDPRWLIHLPPTMSPPETSAHPDLLEHPAAAFAYYRAAGIDRVVCEAKHMGSRAIVVVCRDAATARGRFGIEDGMLGACYTRTGRPFFGGEDLLGVFLERVRAAIGGAALWETLATDWVCLDAEIMPWSVKAQDLLRRQYAATGAAGRAALREAAGVAAAAGERGVAIADLQGSLGERSEQIDRFVATYGGYCWPVRGLVGVRLAPFHLLASEGAVHVDKPHRWHLDTLAGLVAGDDPAAPLLTSTASIDVELGDDAAERAVVGWWEVLTAGGGEGMVVKPADFVARGGRQGRLVQPAIKCRGREYLRLVYGPEYTAPANLERLRSRAVAGKRASALREFALGIEGLERFVRQEPLHRVHECALAVLALESEAIDPRL